MLTGEELHQNQGSGGKVGGTFEKAGCSSSASIVRLSVPLLPMFL